MTQPIALTPAQAAFRELFLAQTGQGIFAAPWAEQPTLEAIQAVRRLSAELSRAAASRGDLLVTLSRLLAVREHCMRAARSHHPATIREHYCHAAAACEGILESLRDSAGLLPDSALVAWVEGVRSLILAQRALPENTAESLDLICKAEALLDSVQDPLCIGALSDRRLAGILRHAPTECMERLRQLPEELHGTQSSLQQQAQKRADLLNHRLADVHMEHERAFRAVLLWGGLQILCMATLPLNGRFFGPIPWSLPFLIAVPVIWWWTWERPFRGRRYFFEWLYAIRRRSLADFHAATANLPDPLAEFEGQASTLLTEAQTCHQLLEAFYLWTLPEEMETAAPAEAAAAAGRTALSGTWMAEMRDRHPLRLAELLPLRPSAIPSAVRIWYG